MGERRWDPEAELAALAAGARARCTDIGMRIDRHGTWYHEGAPIGRAELVRLFATALRRAPDGSHWLLTPFEQIPVEVEDAPFLAVELERQGEDREQRLRFRTNLDRWVMLGEEAELRLRPDARGACVPYLGLERGLEARIVRPVYYELAELAVPGEADGALGVWSAGRFFPLETDRVRPAEGEA
ncbi:MAG TPA: DUF1285 domain-containing protein [Rhodospirillales bacterium]|nr:DUF1285 domain-containing protein [Rhodospirillales bacterium]